MDKRGKRGNYGRQQRVKARVKAPLPRDVSLVDARVVRDPVEVAQVAKKIRADLKETWKEHMSKVHLYERFTPKQLEFFRNYARNGKTNVMGSARAAYPECKNPATLFSLGTRNLKIDGAADLVEAFIIEEKQRVALRVEDVAAWFEKIAETAIGEADYTNANRAMENYAKYLGMFIDRKEIAHTTVKSKDELDARIAELTAVLREEGADVPMTDGATIN